MTGIDVSVAWLSLSSKPFASSSSLLTSFISHPWPLRVSNGLQTLLVFIICQRQNTASVGRRWPLFPSLLPPPSFFPLLGLVTHNVNSQLHRECCFVNKCHLQNIESRFSYWPRFELVGIETLLPVIGVCVCFIREAPVNKSNCCLLFICSMHFICNLSSPFYLFLQKDQRYR